MKRLTALFALLALIALSPPLAAAGGPHGYQKRIAKTLAAFPSCGTLNEGELVVVIDASSNSDCDAEPEEDRELWMPAVCVCHGGVRHAIFTVADLSAYVPVTKNGQQTITATGTGNGIDLTAADKVTAAAPGGFEISGPVLVGLGSEDDSKILGVDGSQVLMDCVSGICSISVSAGDVMLLSSNTGCVKIQGVNQCGADATAPYTCSGGSSPLGYYTDTSGPDLCYCNGSSWSPVDGVGSCS